MDLLLTMMVRILFLFGMCELMSVLFVFLLSLPRNFFFGNLTVQEELRFDSSLSCRKKSDASMNRKSLWSF